MKSINFRLFAFLPLFLWSLFFCSCDCAAIENKTEIDSESEPAREACEPFFTASPTCSIAGGLCLRKKDCPPGYNAQNQFVLADTFCPKGWVCCNGLPNKVKSCIKRGGQCMDVEQCGPGTTDIGGRCQEGQHCCARAQEECQPS